MAIMKSSEASIGAKDQPLALLLRTAIDNLNEQLGPELGENAIQNAASSGLDFSPEGTSQRIVNLSTGFYEPFKAQHKNDSEAESLQKFLNTINKGIDRGFNDSRDILASLDVLDGDVAKTIDQTYDLVQLGIKAFETLINQQSQPE